MGSAERATGVVLKVKNYSARYPRKIVKTAVSWWRGADNIPEKERNGATVEAIQREALNVDKTKYEKKIKPTTALLMHDGKNYAVPPAASADEEPPAVIVPEGLYDLYCGNYARMNSADINERVDEANRLAMRRAGKDSPVIQYDAEGNHVSGFLEFIREEVRPQAAKLDAAKLRSGDIEEV